jgi:hypothetical protein
MKDTIQALREAIKLIESVIEGEPLNNSQATENQDGNPSHEYSVLIVPLCKHGHD